MFEIIVNESRLHRSPKSIRESLSLLLSKMIQKLKSDSCYILCIKETESLDFIFWIIAFADGNKEQLGKSIISFLQYLSIFSLRDLEFQSIDENEASVKKQDLDLMIFRICQAAFREDPEKSLLLFTKIFDNMFSPLYFIEFIRSSFESPSTHEVRILTLNCLVVLVGKYSYEYDNFYVILYKMVQEELTRLKERSEDSHSAGTKTEAKVSSSLFDNKHTPKFLRILEIALKSNRLSKSLTNSFIKVV
jgi:hypothetical protein